MSRNTPWDQLHKAMLGEQLAAHGRVAPGLELSGEPLRADLAYFWPDSGLDTRRLRSLGLLGQMLEQGACIFEPHSAHPDEADLRSAALKAQYLWRLCQARGEPGPGRVWLITSGRPTTMLELFGCEPCASPWPAGVYQSTRGLGLAIVVLSELPAVRPTLTLRLMGRGRILAQAWTELQALPEDEPERQLLPLIARYARVIIEASRCGQLALEPEEEEVWMDSQQWFEHEKHKSQQEGIEKTSRRMAAMRLGRTLGDDEAATIRALIEAGRDEELTRAVLECDAEGLAAWLAEQQQHSP